MALLTGSPAIGAGTSYPITTDQRGEIRSSTVDLGAYAYDVAAPTVLEVTPDAGSTLGGTGVTIIGTNLLYATERPFRLDRGQQLVLPERHRHRDRPRQPRVQ